MSRLYQSDLHAAAGLPDAIGALSGLNPERSIGILPYNPIPSVYASMGPYHIIGGVPLGGGLDLFGTTTIYRINGLKLPNLCGCGCSK